MASLCAWDDSSGSPAHMLGWQEAQSMQGHSMLTANLAST